MDKKTHLSVLKVLAEAGMNVPVEDSEIIAMTGLPHAMATKVFFELTESNHPMIEKVDGGDGTISYRLIAEPELIGLNMDLHGSAPVPARELPDEMVSQDEADARRDRAPSIGTQSIGDYTFGVSKVSDDILRILLETPKTGADLLEEIPASPDRILSALEQLEAAHLIGGITMELDSEKAYSIADDYRDDIEVTLADEFVYKEEPQPQQRASVVSVVRAMPVQSFAQEPEAPAASLERSEPQPESQPQPQRTISAPVAYHQEPESTEGLGAVAIRDIKQRSESIQKIHEFLDGKRMSKKELFDKVLPYNAVRKLKILFEELLASGELREIQEGRNKYVELGSAPASVSASPSPRPAERQPQETSTTLGSVVKDTVATNERAAVQPEPARAASPAPAPAPMPTKVATPVAAAPQPEVKRNVEPATIAEGADMFAMFRQMEKRVIELEAENRILREFMDKVSITARVA